MPSDTSFRPEHWDDPGVETAIRWAGTRPAIIELLPLCPTKRPGVLAIMGNPERMEIWHATRRIRSALWALPQLPEYLGLFYVDDSLADRFANRIGIKDAVDCQDFVEVERILIEAGDDRINDVWRELGGDPDRDDHAKDAALQSSAHFLKAWVKRTVDDAYEDVIYLRAQLLERPKTSRSGGGIVGYVRSPLPPSLRFAVLNRDGYTCRYCGRKAPEVPLEIDHRVPVSRGGGDDIDNLVTSCVECNRGKSNKYET